jgi:hypothetical protein
MKCYAVYKKDFWFPKGHFVIYDNFSWDSLLNSLKIRKGQIVKIAVEKLGDR